MDKKEPGKKSSEDVARESLIGISYQLPEKDITAENLPKNREGEKVVEPLNHDGKEKYRSELISISHLPPLDVEALPVFPGQPDA